MKNMQTVSITTLYPTCKDPIVLILQLLKIRQDSSKYALFQRKVQFLKEKGKSKIIKYHTKLLLPFSNNVGWMTNFENTNQLFQSSVKTVWCSSEFFKT